LKPGLWVTEGHRKL